MFNYIQLKPKTSSDPGICTSHVSQCPCHTWITLPEESPGEMDGDIPPVQS